MRKAAYVNLNQPEDNAHTLIQNLQFILQICVKLSAVPKADRRPTTKKRNLHQPLAGPTGLWRKTSHPNENRNRQTKIV